MPPPLASPIQDANISGVFKTPSSHEIEAELTDMKNQLMLILTALCNSQHRFVFDVDNLLNLGMEKASTGRPQRG